MSYRGVDMDKAKTILPLVYGFIEDCNQADLGMKELFLAFMFCIEEIQPGVMEEIDQMFADSRGTIQ